jgi:hypothetical protein
MLVRSFVRWSRNWLVCCVALGSVSWLSGCRLVHWRVRVDWLVQDELVGLLVGKLVGCEGLGFGSLQIQPAAGHVGK